VLKKQVLSLAEGPASGVLVARRPQHTLLYTSSFSRPAALLDGLLTTLYALLNEIRHSVRPLDGEGKLIFSTAA